MIRNKTIKFNLDKMEERELWEKLQKLPHGEFSTMTKEFWEDELSDNWKMKITIGKNTSPEELEFMFEDIRKKMKEDKPKC